MKALVEIISQARVALEQLTKPVNGFEQLVFSMDLEHSLCLLDWLYCQTIYPQFYWHHREKEEEIVICGQVCQFKNINEAQQLIRKIKHIDLKIWGINGFEQTAETVSNYYILPRLELSIKSNQLILKLNLYHQPSIDDIERAKSFLHCLVLDSFSSLLSPVMVVDNEHMPNKQAWQSMITRALQAIDQGHLDKVVLARKSNLTLNQAVKPIEIIKESQKVNHNCYQFMLALSEYKGFVGTTPERLFYRNEKSLETEALAGTVSAGKTLAEKEQLADWLLNDKKNQHENMLVVNDICQRLDGKLKSISVVESEVLSLRKVQHLCRKIKGELSEIDDANCLTWLQPTAAVAGFPRENALQFIKENEPFERQWYAGSMGYLSEKQSEFIVTLRSAFINGNTVSLYAGAGIVKGSDPEHEWLEIETKADVLKSVFIK